MKNIAIRCDGYAQLGGGHIMRCLTLADALAEKGANICLMVNDGAQNIAPALTSSPHKIIYLNQNGAHANGVAATIEAIEANFSNGLDSLITDLYVWDKDQEAQLRNYTKTLIVIDDLANRPHDCDLLIDQTYGRTPSDYQALVPAGAALLLGSQFSLLRKDFIEARGAALLKRLAPPKGRILISLGLTDVGAISEKAALAALLCRQATEIHVVVSTQAPSMPVLTQLAKEQERVLLHHDLNAAEMVALMVEADLAIGAAGTTTWERCCLGLPSATLVLAENQQEIAKVLTDAGAIMATNIDELSQVVSALLSAPNQLLDMSKNASQLVDGLGAQRLSAAIIDKHQKIFIRPANLDDAQPLFDWRNDPESRAVSGNSDVLVWADHLNWFTQSLTRSDRHILIGEAIMGSHAQNIGMVRFDHSVINGQNYYNVSINMAPSARGKGFGAALLRAGMAHIRQKDPLAQFTGQIRPDNHASLKLFSSCGFLSEAAVDGWIIVNFHAQQAA